ncbi:MAG: transglutaminase domain-containing protein, partial [Chloroflexota bacterium]
MTHQQDALTYYAEAGAFTDFGQYADHSQYLPDSVPELVEVVQNVGIYDLFARDFYGVTLSDERMSHIHLRPVETMLEAIFAVSDKALTETRTPNERIACRCHAFTKLIVSLLRAKGIPARARCGFGTYFGTGNYEDHWV